jgi:hypothetical protein
LVGSFASSSRSVERLEGVEDVAGAVTGEGREQVVGEALHVCPPDLGRAEVRRVRADAHGD